MSNDPVGDPLMRMICSLNSTLLGLGLAALALSSVAQTVKLREPTRTVFKCEEAGKVTYSDAPCLGAQKVDVEPTRGLNESSGTERVGKDVSGERLNEAVAGATRPITGMTAEERAVNHRRFTLSPAAKAECALLDRRLVNLETAERESVGAEKADSQKQLFESRLRARDIGC